MGEADVELRRQLLERAIKIFNIAIRHLEILSHGCLLKDSYEYCAGSYRNLAVLVETEPELKREYLRKAVEIARKALLYKDYGPGAGHELSKALFSLATMSANSEEKTDLLREALSIREAHIRETDLLFPHSAAPSNERYYLALIKAELSNLDPNYEVKIHLLQGAAADIQQSVDLSVRWIASPSRMQDFGDYRYYESSGDILFQLYTLTKQDEVARKAIKAYEGTITALARWNLVGFVPPVRWKIAKVYDAIGEFQEASKAFRKASEEYRLAATKIPSLATAFAELGSYLDSWSKIEDARLSHNEEQYLRAAEDYQEAAGFLRTSRSWRHLAKHYAGCSLLERGEALSRQEKQESAIEVFNSAVNAFKEAKEELDNSANQTPGAENQEMKDRLEINNGREDYCLGRIHLEEGKILDKQGEKVSSAKKYREASKAFSGLLAEGWPEQDRSEMETMARFCDACAKMKEAEGKASPELFADAAQLFMQIEAATSKEKLRLLALANASICRALENGTRFRRTRNTALYSEIKRQLETASDYYQEAALQNAADWTRATQRLFDALVYMTDAETEKEPKRKTELYHLAEKHLELAAKLYGQSGFESKKEEALKHLERAREEKELLLTPMDALAGNPSTSTSSIVPIPTSLTGDKATGLERFESANVVGNMSVSKQELGVGSDLVLELEMANVGKTAATLMKLENITSEGIELDRQKIPHRVEDNYIDMKGKRLEYLKTFEIKIPMRTTRKGTIQLGPRILFADETGNYRSYSFEPAALTVRELGISGWLKGPK
jgi:hypothetical protein